MTRSKRSIILSIQSLEKRKSEHVDKIEQALKLNTNLYYINKWKHEIENFENQIKELKSKIKK